MANLYFSCCVKNFSVIVPQVYFLNDPSEKSIMFAITNNHGDSRKILSGNSFPDDFSP